LINPGGGFRGENVCVFFRFERAGGVDQQTAGPEAGEGVAEDSSLAGGVADEVLGREAPLDLGVAAECARAGTGGINQDPVKHGPEGQRLGGIELDPGGGAGVEQEAAEAAGAGITGDGEEVWGFEGEGGLIARGGAEVEKPLSGA
jgi:hypothetical protein